MWWLLPAALGAAAILLNRGEGARAQVPVPDRPDTHSVLSRNLRALRAILETSGSRPRLLTLGLGGAGKSTLLDELTGNACTPRPLVGVESDTTTWATDPTSPLTLAWGDVLVIDTPGYGTAQHPVQVLMEHLSACDLDSVLFVIRSKPIEADLVAFHAAMKAPWSNRVRLVCSAADTHWNASAAEVLVARESVLSGARAAHVVSSATGQGMDELREAVARDLRAGWLRRRGHAAGVTAV